MAQAYPSEKHSPVIKNCEKLSGKTVVLGKCLSGGYRRMQRLQRFFVLEPPFCSWICHLS